MWASEHSQPTGRLISVIELGLLVSTDRRALEDPPGGLLAWIVVAVEFATFGLVFGWIASARRADPEGYARMQVELDPSLGLALTAVLVTSGALAARGVVRYRAGQLGAARSSFVAAGLLGAGFLALKGIDWAHVLRGGHGLGTSDAWDLYLLSTSFHAAHVVVGVGLLVGVAGRVGRTVFADEETAVVGSVAFWHLCDVIWFFLFPLLFART
jgi:nitric oxide reductase NorE protein